MMKIQVGRVTIEQANNYGPSGTDRIDWLLKIDGVDHREKPRLTWTEIQDLRVALNALNERAPL